MPFPPDSRHSRPVASRNISGASGRGFAKSGAVTSRALYVGPDPPYAIGVLSRGSRKHG